MPGLLTSLAITGAAAVVATPVTAGRRRRKRGKRRSRQHGIAVAERATSIPPNCIHVCCDGACDSWTMCMTCVTWPKPTTTSGVLSPA